MLQYTKLMVQHYIPLSELHTVQADIILCYI